MQHILECMIFLHKHVFCTCALPASIIAVRLSSMPVRCMLVYIGEHVLPACVQLKT